MTLEARADRLGNAIEMPLAALSGGLAAGQMDMLTALLQEMSPLAGATGDSTAETLVAGTSQIDALDEIFATWG
jgi:hypothetical protein